MAMTPERALEVESYYKDSLVRARAVSKPGTPPQALTPPFSEAVDQAAAAIVLEFGSDRQKHLVGIAGQIGGLIEQKRAEAWEQYLNNIDER
jgi:GAF domain-containing protein